MKNYIIPCIAATATFISGIWLLTSGTLMLIQGGYFEGFSLLTAALPSSGASILGAIILFIFFFVLSVQSKNWGYMLAYIIGIAGSLISIFIFIFLGSSLSFLLVIPITRYLNLINVRIEELSMVLDQLLDGVLAFLISVWLLLYIKKLSRKTFKKA